MMMRRDGYMKLVIRCLLLLSLVASGPLPAWAYEVVPVSQGGTVTGTVQFAGELPPPPLLPQADNTDPPRPARMASCADRSTNSRRDMPLAMSFLPWAFDGLSAPVWPIPRARQSRPGCYPD